MSAWIVRDAVPEDESCLGYMWLKSYAHAPEVREYGLASAGEDGHPDEIRYWKIHQPIMTLLLHSTRVRVACDPKRSTYEDGQKAVVLGWSCTAPGFVHWVGIKRSIMKLEDGAVAAELMRDLLGAEMDRPQRVTFDLMDVRKLRLVPDSWRRDRAWLSSLRQLSSRIIDGDESYMRIANGLFDVEEWSPNSERAA